MSAPIIWFGSKTKLLKSALVMFDQATIYSGTADPTSSSTAGTIGDIYIRTGTPHIYQKITTSATDTNWKLISVAASAGDISETSFSIANNQAVAADVTGLAFSNSVVRSAVVSYSIFVDATSDLFASGQLLLIQKGSSWEIARSEVGDNTQVVFTVTNAGQVQYTSANYSGFSAGTMKFRAITTSV